MKKNYKELLIIFIFSIMIMVPVISNYYKGHDTNFHVANISALANQISIHNIFAKEPLAEIANNFGYGTRFFYPPLPHLIAAYFTKILNNVVIGMRLTEWLTFLLSGIAFYFLGIKIFKNKKIATVASCFYMAAPYHLSEVFIRDAFSEMFIPIALPLIILGLLELVDQNYKRFFFLFIIGYTLAIYSHLAMSIYLTLMLIFTFFIIYFKKIFTKKNILYLCLASLTVLLLTSPFWVPLLEHKIKGSYAIFLPFYITAKGDLRFSAINPLIYLDFSNPHTYGYIRFHLQFIITILLFISLFLFFKKKMWKEKIWLFTFVFALLSVIMTSPFFPWYYTPDLLQTLQFPWRLCLYVAFGIILLAMIPLKQMENKKYFSIFCIIGVLCSLLGSYYYTYHVNEEIVDINNINYNLGMGNQEEYLPERIAFNHEYYENRKQDIVILSGTADIHIIENNVPNLIFEVEENENLIIELPRIYYLGYQLEKDGEIIDLVESENGFLKAEIEKSGTYTLIYSGTKGMHYSYIIAGVTLAFCGISCIYFKKRR